MNDVFDFYCNMVKDWEPNWGQVPRPRVAHTLKAGKNETRTSLINPN